jgi:hypothetical protein
MRMAFGFLAALVSPMVLFKQPDGWFTAWKFSLIFSNKALIEPGC